MRILVTGASGFIGSHIAARLRAAGHAVVSASRSRPALAGVEWMPCDFAKDLSPEAWLPRLKGIDAVVNAVGILTENRRQRFAEVHERAPAALFWACERAGVRRVIQISALGADEAATSAYHRSKHAADRVLLACALDGVVLQPSLVYGEDGASSRLFRTLALLPWLPLFKGGEPWVQPVHVDDLSELVLRLLESPDGPRGVLPVVGPRALRFEALVQAYRTQLGYGPARRLWLPEALGDWAATLGSCIPGSAFTRETWAMLKRGNTGDGRVLAAWLGREGRAPEAFIAPAQREALRAQALWALGQPMLLACLVLIWWWSGLCALLFAEPEVLAGLLEPLGLRGAGADAALWAGSLLDLALGCGLLIRRWRKPVLLAQLAVILGYSLVIAAFLPAQWLHPFAPMVKNLPILAIVVLLYLGAL